MKSIMTVLRFCSFVFLAGSSLGIANSDLKNRVEDIQNGMAIWNNNKQEQAQPPKHLTPKERMSYFDQLAVLTSWDPLREYHYMTDQELEEQEAVLGKKIVQIDSDLAQEELKAREVLSKNKKEWDVDFEQCGTDVNCRDKVLATMVTCLELAVVNKVNREKELNNDRALAQASLNKIDSTRKMKQEQAEQEKRRQEELKAREAQKQQEDQED